MTAMGGDDHLARLYSPTIEEPWFRSLFRNIREAIHPPQLPPLQVTSKPVAVRDIWGLYGKDKKSNLFSLAIHGTVVVLLFTVASSKAVQQMAKSVIPLVAPDIAPYVPKMAEQKQQMQGGGGGGDRSPTPASKGRLPKPSMKQFTPPMAVVKPEERLYASGVTSIVRLASWAVAPSFAGLFMQGVSMAMPLFIGAGMKITYDVLLYRAFRNAKPPEER